jgi:hypothetical protein
VFHPKLQHFQDIIIPAGCVVVLPGYTLERASCGIFKAALYKVVSFLTGALLHFATKFGYMKSTIKTGFQHC